MILFTQVQNTSGIVSWTAFCVDLVLPYLNKDNDKMVGFFHSRFQINFVRLLLNLLLILNSIIVLLPLIHAPFFTPAYSLIILLPIVTVFIWKRYFIHEASDVELHHGICRNIFNVHGVIYFFLIQPLVLIYGTNLIMTQCFGDPIFSIIIGMMIVAGTAVLAGGFNVILNVASIIGIVIVAGIPIVSMFFEGMGQRIIALIVHILNIDAILMQITPASATDPVVLLVGFILVAVMMKVIVYSHFVRSKNHFINLHSTRQTILYGVTIALVIALIPFLYLTAEIPVSTDIFSSPIVRYITVLNIWGLLILFTGFFTFTYHQCAVLASHFAGIFEKSDEGKILVQKLATVTAVVISVLLTSLVKVSSSIVLAYFIEFVVFFSTPVAVMLLFRSVTTKDHTAGLTAGVVIGEIAAVVEYFSRATMLLSRDSIYSFAVEITIITVVITVAVSAGVSLRMVRKRLQANRMAEL